MSKNSIIGLIVGGIVLAGIGGGWYFVNSAQKNMAEESNVNEPEVAGEDAMVKDDDVMMDKGDELMSDEKAEDAMEKSDDELMEKEDVGGDAMEKEDNDMEDEQKMEKDDSDEQAMVNPGRYVNYGDVDVSALDGKVVLDFAASWCPTCQAFERNISANLDQIPSDVTIVKVDYDNSTELKSQYGVTYQHTFVQINSNGDQIKKWQGATTLDGVIAEIQ